MRSAAKTHARIGNFLKFKLKLRGDSPQLPLRLHGRHAQRRRTAPATTGSPAALYSGCHCTPTTNRAPGRLTASICPSGATASTSSSGAGRSMPWPCSELTMISAAPVSSRRTSARGQRDRVRRAVAFFDRHVAPAPAMVEPLRHLEDALMQGAAERDIQLLDAAADRQHRHVAAHRLADQRQCRRVAVGIVQRALHARRPAVMVRLDIRRAAGQQQAVEPVEQRGAIDLRADRRDQHRQAAGGLDDGVRDSVR